MKKHLNKVALMVTIILGMGMNTVAYATEHQNEGGATQGHPGKNCNKGVDGSLGNQGNGKGMGNAGGSGGEIPSPPVPQPPVTPNPSQDMDTPVVDGDNTVLATANADAQGYASQASNQAYTGAIAVAQKDANTAQGNSEAYTNQVGSQVYAKAATMAQKDANTAQSNSEAFSTAGDKTTLARANQFSTAGDASTLAAAKQDSQVMATAAQNNSEAYTNHSYQQANVNAQGYANQAQSNAETFAQGAANQAQTNAEEFAASGIAAALAMPPAPFLSAGKAYVGIQEGEYDGQTATGIRATYQLTRRLNANLGFSSGTGLYGHMAVTGGVGYEFGG